MSENLKLLLVAVVMLVILPAFAHAVVYLFAGPDPDMRIPAASVVGEGL